MTTAFFVPMKLCGAVVLHGVGRDGTLVTLAGRVGEYLRTKLIVATVLAGGGSTLAGLALWLGRGKLNLQGADVGVKRLSPARGVSLGCEWAYWAAGGGMAMCCDLLWRSAVTGGMAGALAGLVGFAALVVAAGVCFGLEENRLQRAP